LAGFKSIKALRGLFNEIEMKKLALALMCCSSAYAGSTDLSVYYDPNRSLNIYELSHYHRPTEKIEVYGFLETYKNSSLAFPQDKQVLFGKTWIMHSVSDRVSVGLEIEHGINNAGMFTTSRKFEQDKLFILPKIGIKINLEK
jgi:hypothetical protein